MALLVSGCSGLGLRADDQSQPPPDIILATTTSTYDTGLLDQLIPAFAKRYGFTIKPIAVGTGEALTMGERGEADILLVHAPAAEQAFMAAGYGTSRKAVMYNWFLLVGPEKDDLGIQTADSLATAWQAIADNEAQFISRGDNSGTHQKELSLWQTSNRQPQGSWYQEVGQGMAATLRIADEKQAYTLTDEGTFRAQQQSLSLRAAELTDQRLRNDYSVIVVAGSGPGATAFSRFLISEPGQSLIREFRAAGYDKPLFIPDARQ